MDNENFYQILKDKAAFLANAVAVLTFVGSALYFIYTKFFKEDHLRASYHLVYMPIPAQASADTLLYTNCRFLTIVHLENTGNTSIQDIEIELDGFVDPEKPRGYYTVSNYVYLEREDFFHIDKNTKPIKIPELKAKSAKHLYVYSTYSDPDYFSLIKTEDNVYTIRPSFEIIPDNDFDHVVTAVLVHNKVIQVIVYILVCTGIYYFIRYQLPLIIKLLPSR